MEKSEKRVITVLLTRYYNAFSNFIYFISGRGYTHASIALDEENEYYYSFNLKGFRKEYPKMHNQRSEKSVSYKLEISLKDFNKIKQKIEEIEHGKDKFRYSKIGIIFCLLHIPFKRKNCYFCSQFVAEMLTLSDKVSMRKKASLYLPNHLQRELKRQSCLREIVFNPI